MRFSKQAPVISEELRILIKEHADLEARIEDEMKQLVPDQIAISSLKRLKVRLNDEMQAVLSSLPPSEFKPVNPKLYVMTDAELQAELKRRERAHQRKEATVGPGSFELSKLSVEVADVKFEIDRRELEALFAEEQVAV